jgi:hypothetical protein
MTRLAAHRRVARHGELVSGAGTSGRLSFGMAASRGAGSRSPLDRRAPFPLPYRPSVDNRALDERRV